MQSAIYLTNQVKKVHFLKIEFYYQRLTFYIIHFQFLFHFTFDNANFETQ